MPAKFGVKLLILTFHAPSSELFFNLNILKISDLIKLRNISLVKQILNNHCPPRVASIFALSFYQHGHRTRGSSISLLSRPNCRTTSYGINSITYQSILNWNKFQQALSETSIVNFSYIL